MESVQGMISYNVYIASVFLNVFLFVLAIGLYVHGKGVEKSLAKQAESDLNRVQLALDALKVDLSDRLHEVESLRGEVALLKPYAGIVDVEAYCKGLRNQAEAEVNEKRRSADMAAENKVNLAEQELQRAKEAAKALRTKAQEVMGTSMEQSRTIIANAEDRAKEIAGDALDAKSKADLWENAATAARNVVNGYGDEYIVPNTSLLDDLAEDFSHKEAGIQLKEARNITKAMIKGGYAADCDYVEKFRKETAIRFVTDAYVGKVDSVLSNLKHNNFGKLYQQIEDAFSLVNLNGAAFRNARILPEFHAARLNELKLGVITAELKLEEREEQRAIREQIREEERARKEYEAAMKAAIKEEKLLMNAMDKARAELLTASEEQKAAYEMQLADLQEQLEQAEAKNQRALSMAQQTKRGHVYIISNVGSFGEQVFKIGMTRRLEPNDRVKELGDASVPFAFDVHAMIFSDDAPALENELHRRFGINQVNKVNPRKEFFKVSLADIRQVIDEMGMEVHWTMKAEAYEYRETLAIEEALKQGKSLQDLNAGIRVH